MSTEELNRYMLENAADYFAENTDRLRRYEEIFSPQTIASEPWWELTTAGDRTCSISLDKSVLIESFWRQDEDGLDFYYEYYCEDGFILDEEEPIEIYESSDPFINKLKDEKEWQSYVCSSLLLFGDIVLPLSILGGLSSTVAFRPIVDSTLVDNPLEMKRIMEERDVKLRGSNRLSLVLN